MQIEPCSYCSVHSQRASGLVDDVSILPPARSAQAPVFPVESLAGCRMCERAALNKCLEFVSVNGSRISHLVCPKDTSSKSGG